MEDDRERHFVQSFERGLAVIRSFSQARDRLTIAEVADATDLSSAAARRFVLTLAELGYLRAEGRDYALTTKVLELGSAYLASTPLPATVQPHLDAAVVRVRDSTPLTVLDAGVAVRDGDDVVYIAYIRAESLFVLNVSTGSRYPAWIASTGRVLLGAEPAAELQQFLDRVQLARLTHKTVATKAALRRSIAESAHRGWSVVDQEYDERLCSYAVPVLDRAGETVAALNVSVMHTDEHHRHSHAVIATMTQAAAHIEADLCRRSPSEPRESRGGPVEGHRA